MIRVPSLLFSALFVVSAVPWTASSAYAANPTVAIGEFSGPTGAQLAYSIERALRGKAEVIPNRTWEAEAERLGVGGKTPEDAVQVGRSLGVDAALIGEVVRAGRSWQANVQVVAVRPGKVEKTWTFDNTQLRALSNVAQRQAWTQLQGPLRVAAAAPATGSSGAQAAAPSGPSAGAGPEPTGPKRVVMLPFEGGQMGASTRVQIARNLNDTGQVEFFRLDEAASASQEIGVSMDDPVGRIAMSEVHRVDAFIGGRIFTRQGQFYGAVSIYQGLDGQPVEVLKLRRRTLDRLQSDLAERAVPAVRRAQRAGVPASAGLSLDVSDMQEAMGTGPTDPSGSAASAGAAGEARAEAKKPKKKRERGADARSRSPLQLAVGFESFSRRFSFNDPVTPSRDYSADFLPAVAVDAVWFPAAHFVQDGVARNLGLAFRTDAAIGVTSQDAVTEAQFPTNSFAFLAGARFRVPLGASELGFEAGYGTDRFSLDADPAVVEGSPGTPNAEYEFVRLAADGRWQVTPGFDLGARFGYRLLTTAGNLSSDEFFPNTSGGGLEGGLVLGTSILDPMHLELGAEVNHYFFSFNPEVGDPQVAGGALDQYFTGFVRAVFVL